MTCKIDQKDKILSAKSCCCGSSLSFLVFSKIAIISALKLPPLIPTNRLAYCSDKEVILSRVSVLVSGSL